MGASLSAGVLLTSYRIRESDFDARGGWVVTLWALAAGAFTAVGFGVTVLAGAVIGRGRVEQHRLTDGARESRDAMAVTDSLLRHDDDRSGASGGTDDPWAADGGSAGE